MEGVSNNTYLESLGLRTSPTQKASMSESDQFLHLMLAQIQNQDPMQPMENGEFLSQLAQFNMAGGVAELQKSFSEVASTLQSNQALQASSMVGRTVVVPSEMGSLSNGSMTASVAVPQEADRVDVKIYDENGVLVKTLNLGPSKGGIEEFEWNGVGADGNDLPDGQYEIKATAWYGGNSEAVPTMASALVESVTIGTGGQGIALNLEGLGSWRMADVLQIRQ